MPKIQPFLLALLIWCACALPTVAVPAEESVAFNFNKADIRSVIKSVAQITGKNFIIDPKVTGEVSIVTSENMPASELYSLFLAVLQVHGFTAIETGNVVKIVPHAQAKQEAISVYGSGERVALKNQAVTSLYKLHYVPAEQLVAILRPLAGSDSYMVAHKESNTVIVADEAANVKRLVRIIERLDLPGKGDTEVLSLQYAAAGDLATVITSLEGKREKGSGEPLIMIPDHRTNSILVSGDKQEILRIKGLVSSLDTPVTSEDSTQVIFLRYAQAKDLLPILNGVIKAEAPNPKEPKVGKTPVTIQADEPGNALVITAGAAQMRSLQAVVRTLDIRRAQLMIEAVIAEVSTDKSAEMGIQWRSAQNLGPDSSGAIGGTNFNATGSGINQAALNPLAVGDGLSLGFFNGTSKILGTEILNLGVLLRALSQAGDTNILSTPSLMTMDNQEAEIVVGQNVPFPTGSYTTTGTTTSTVNPFTTYERHDVGIKLKVKPMINEGNTIRLDISQEVSSVASFDKTAGPITNTRSIKTAVLVDDGKMLVLGGLISDDLEETQQKVPLLGDVPMLGAFFRYNNSKHVKRNLMVFLRPVIVRDAETNSRVTLDKYDYIRGEQQGYGRRRTPLPLLPPEPIPLLPPDLPAKDDTSTLPPESSPAGRSYLLPPPTPPGEPTLLPTPDAAIPKKE